MIEKNKRKLRAKKFRGDWGQISPVTKIIPDKRRKKLNRIVNRYLREGTY